MVFHIAWVCNRFARRQRIRTTAGQRLSDHSYDWLSKTRQQAENPLPGFPWQRSAWKVFGRPQTQGDQRAQ
eukprot:7766294-Alexandrium_andersonii.AAC.1